MKGMNRWITGIHVFTGLGGMAGGTAAVLDPVSPLGAPASMLRNGPFQDFLIPGIVLLCVIGLGNLAAAVLVWRKAPHHGIVSGVAGAALIGWIVVQCWVLQTVAALHVVFFLVGAAQGLLAFALLYRQNSFPVNLLKKWTGLGA